MLNLKKTSAAVLALGCSVAFAGTMGPVCTPGSVTVPCESTAWDLGIQALYLKPTYDSDIGFYYNGATNPIVYEGYNPGWDWGFRLEGSYHFSTGNDFTVNWVYYKNDTRFNTWIDLGNNNFLIGYADYDLKANIVNFEFGQHVDFGMFKNIRFHGGAQYFNLKRDGSGTVVPTTAANYLFAQGYTKFSGFGPRTGMDMSYDFNDALAVYAKAAAALLVGKSESQARSRYSLAYNRSLKMTTVVPNLEAKLGATYTYAMSEGNVILDAGWMWTNYFNAVFTVPSVESDFAMQGPYIGLKYIGNV